MFKTEDHSYRQGSSSISICGNITYMFHLKEIIYLPNNCGPSYSFDHIKVNDIVEIIRDYTIKADLMVYANVNQIFQSAEKRDFTNRYFKVLAVDDTKAILAIAHERELDFSTNLQITLSTYMLKVAEGNISLIYG